MASQPDLTGETHVVAGGAGDAAVVGQHQPLAAVASWGHRAASAWAGPSGAGSIGDADRLFRWASVTKLVTALAIWVAVEEETVSWDDQAGPTGSTLRHLLAHASGLAPYDDRVLAAPGTRRIYSNRGFEEAAEHVAKRAGMEFHAYAYEAVLQPLGMNSTLISGSPAHGAAGTLADLARLAGELLQPRLVDRSTWQEATATAFAGLPGTLPGFGAQPDNAWGLGVEVRDSKEPHWTGRSNSQATFGHFGQSGSLLWVDPVAEVTLVSLSERPFGPWATDAWPALSEAVLAHAVGPG